MDNRGFRAITTRIGELERTDGRGVKLFNSAMKMMIFQLLLVTCVEKV